MTRAVKELSPDQKKVIEDLLCRPLPEDETISVRSFAPPLVPEHELREGPFDRTPGVGRGSVAIFDEDWYKPISDDTYMEAVALGESALKRGEYLAHEDVGRRLERFLKS